jgi:hypothetical protein
MSLFNFIVDSDCPTDTIYFANPKMPVWQSKGGQVFYNVKEIGDQHLRGIVNMLLRSGSKQYWCNEQNGVFYRSIFEDLARRGLWTDAEELQSRLEGVVKRKDGN